ncbi:unnamed protein product [Calypogeia fissa]
MAVHVVNIPHIVDEKDLLEFLEEFVGKGTVMKCKILRHQDSARSKGVGFVDFRDKQVAMFAAQLSREEKLRFYNRVLTMRIHDRPPSPEDSYEHFPIEDGILSMGCLTAEDMLYSMWSHSGPFIIEIIPENQILSLRLQRPDLHWMMEYKMEFHLSEVSKLSSVQVNGKNNGFFLQVKESPPLLYCRTVEGAQVLTGDPYVDVMESFLGRNRREHNADDRYTWVRTTDFTPNVIGQSFIYVVEIPGPEAVFLDAFLKKADIYKTTDSKLRTTGGEPYASDQVVVPLLNPDLRGLPFEHLFKINNLVQQGKLSGPTLHDGKFFKLIKDSPLAAVSFALQAMSGLEYSCFEPIKFVKEQLDAYKRGIKPPLAKLEKGTVMIHRLLVTPTKVYCMGPEPETSNRIVRQYDNLSSYFLRVNFVDENFGSMNSSILMSEPSTSRSNVYKRIKFILKEGIFIGFRKYEFLAFSSSQLREGQLWMYAPKDPPDRITPEVITPEMIRAGMGDFSRIRNVAKCAARMGQCFSSSTETRKVLPLQVKRIKDINRKTGSVTYCFSDGIGKISEAFARDISSDCGLPDGTVPSAFQIRYGGYKGVVARDPTASSSFKLYLRPSMRKFDAPHMSLEVLAWTKPLPCHLNRQVISLLSTLGVSDSSFLSLQSQAVSKYEHMLDDDAVATEILQESGSDFLALEMLRCGYASQAEPFLRRLLHVFKDAQLHELKQKAKIPVANGRLLMGCLDETGTLQYGQVYIRYTAFSRAFSRAGEFRKENVVTSKVFVAKNPCLHPGDIRTLQAVDVPQLSHMVDCVVFPQCGPRPHPNECSGSDLDGDIYVVSWEESLLPSKVEPPMDYTAPPETALDHPVEVEEIQEFFVNYMVNDYLGVITNAHVVHADKERDKARNPKCLELAELASMAVDFPKTGVPAIIPLELRPKEYPDFMEKLHKTTYTSHRILGKLYRSIIPTRMVFSLGEEDMKLCYDTALIAEGYENHLESALAYKKMYDMKLIGLMNQYGIREEAEVVSGHIVSMSVLYARRQIDVAPKIRLAFKVLQKEAKFWFKGQSRRMDKEEEAAKASAWYHVTYHFRYFNRKDHWQFSKVTNLRVHLLSFPWVVSNILLNLKAEGPGVQLLE